MSNFGGITMYFKKIGKIVIVTYAGNLNLSSANSFVDIGTVPSGYNPLIETSVSYAQINNGIKGTGRITFTPGGHIKAYVQIAGLYEAKFSTSWITA